MEKTLFFNRKIIYEYLEMICFNSKNIDINRKIIYKYL